MSSTTLNPSEISELIRHRIEQFKLGAEARNEGTLISVSDGIVRIHGLAEAMQGEMIELPGDTYALALNLERDSVGAVVLGDYEHLREGDRVKTTGRILEVPVGEALLGRVVNALGQPIDGRGAIAAAGTGPIEKVAPGVIWRKSVEQPVQTGYKSIDAMIPIGRGQREGVAGQLDHLALHHVLETVDAHDAVGHADQRALVAGFGTEFELLDAVLDQLADFGWIERGAGHGLVPVEPRASGWSRVWNAVEEPCAARQLPWASAPARRCRRPRMEPSITLPSTSRITPATSAWSWRRFKRMWRP